MKEIHNIFDKIKQYIHNTDVILKKWEHVIAIFALIVSIYSIFFSYQIEKNITDYEFELSQTPNVLILNQEIQIPFKYDYDIDEDSLGGIEGAIDFITFSRDSFPLKILISNTGTGLALNCKIELSASSQRKAILTCRDIFQDTGLEPATGIMKSGYNFETYLRNYSYEFKDNELYEVEWHGDFERYTQIKNPQISNYPYITPIMEEQEKNYFEIPIELSAFISEAIRQEVEQNNKQYKNIELEITISYQDLNGKKFFSNYLVKIKAVPNTYINFFEPIVRMQLEVQEIK